MTDERRVVSKEEAEASFSAQFPEIEKILEDQTLEQVEARFAPIKESLEKAKDTAGGMGKKAEARKALNAVERVVDLFREMFRMKQEIKNLESGQESGGNTPVIKR